MKAVTTVLPGSLFGSSSVWWPHTCSLGPWYSLPTMIGSWLTAFSSALVSWEQLDSFMIIQVSKSNGWDSRNLWRQTGGVRWCVPLSCSSAWPSSPCASKSWRESGGLAIKSSWSNWGLGIRKLMGGSLTRVWRNSLVTSSCGQETFSGDHKRSSLLTIIMVDYQSRSKIKVTSGKRKRA